MKQILISHASENDAVAGKVSSWLKRNAGLACWLDKTDILPALDCHREIHNGVRSAHALIVLISAASAA